MKTIIEFLHKFSTFHYILKIVFYFIFLLQCTETLEIMYKDNLPEILFKLFQTFNGMEFRSIFYLMNIFHDKKYFSLIFLVFQLQSHLKNFYKSLIIETNSIQNSIICFNFSCRVRIGRIFHLDIVSL